MQLLSPMIPGGLLPVAVEYGLAGLPDERFLRVFVRLVYSQLDVPRVLSVLVEDGVCIRFT